MKTNEVQEKKIDHYLITRFNISFDGQVLSNDLEKIDINTNKDYLNYRFKIFENYTIPSVEKQTNQNFVWIVLFSNKTPQIFKNRIKSMEKAMFNFQPIYANSLKESINILDKKIRKERTGVLVTSRLDNDDALNLSYIETIQNNINWDDESRLLVFPDGIQYDMNKRIMTKYHFPNNHFSTLVCGKGDMFETVLRYNHMDISKFFEVKFLSPKEPMWLEIIHGKNVLNRMFMSFKNNIFDFSVLQKFGYLEEVTPQNKLILYLMIIFNRPINGCNILSRYGFKKTLKKILSKILSKIH